MGVPEVDRKIVAAIDKEVGLSAADLGQGAEIIAAAVECEQPAGGIPDHIGDGRIQPGCGVETYLVRLEVGVAQNPVEIVRRVEHRRLRAVDAGGLGVRESRRENQGEDQNRPPHLHQYSPRRTVGPISNHVLASMACWSDNKPGLSRTELGVRRR